MLAMKMKVRLKANSSSRDTERQPPSPHASTAGRVQVNNADLTHGAKHGVQAAHTPDLSATVSPGHMTVKHTHTGIT